MDDLFGTCLVLSRPPARLVSRVHTCCTWQGFGWRRASDYLNAVFRLLLFFQCCRCLPRFGVSVPACLPACPAQVVSTPTYWCSARAWASGTSGRACWTCTATSTTSSATSSRWGFGSVGLGFHAARAPVWSFGRFVWSFVSKRRFCIFHIVSCTPYHTYVHVCIHVATLCILPYYVQHRGSRTIISAININIYIYIFICMYQYHVYAEYFVARDDNPAEFVAVMLWLFSECSFVTPAAAHVFYTRYHRRLCAYFCLVCMCVYQASRCTAVLI